MPSLLLLFLALAPAQEPVWALPPIEYGTHATDDRVARLARDLEAGTRSLTPEGQPLTIDALLAALEVPTWSQTAVFTKTSFQAKRISPRRPRALYFSDDVYVGYVPGGDVIEVSAIDANEGLVFYTIAPIAKIATGATGAESPRFKRETHRCLQCHAPARAGGLPAHLLRSLHPAPDGQPRLRAGSTHVDHATPHAERWGGWYVTGNVGEMQHLGNSVLAAGQKRLEPANVEHTDFGKLCDARPYPTDTSDVVALLVLEHQTHAQNAILWGGYEARRALHYQSALNRALGQPDGTPVHSTETRLDTAAKRIADALLFVGEPALPGPIGAGSVFATKFQAAGRRTSAGHSLRDLDLETRLFRHPLSYTIGSVAFSGLPAPLRERVWRRIADVLHGADHADVLAILAETHPGDVPDRGTRHGRRAPD